MIVDGVERIPPNTRLCVCKMFRNSAAGPGSHWRLRVFTPTTLLLAQGTKTGSNRRHTHTSKIYTKRNSKEWVRKKERERERTKKKKKRNMKKKGDEGISTSPDCLTIGCFLYTPLIRFFLISFWRGSATVLQHDNRQGWEGFPPDACLCVCFKLAYATPWWVVYTQQIGFCCNGEVRITWLWALTSSWRVERGMYHQEF